MTENALLFRFQSDNGTKSMEAGIILSSRRSRVHPVSQLFILDLFDSKFIYSLSFRIHVLVCVRSHHHRHHHHDCSAVPLAAKVTPRHPFRSPAICIQGQCRRRAYFVWGGTLTTSQYSVCLCLTLAQVWVRSFCARLSQSLLCVSVELCLMPKVCRTTIQYMGYIRQALE